MSKMYIFAIDLGPPASFLCRTYADCLIKRNSDYNLETVVAAADRTVWKIRARCGGVPQGAFSIGYDRLRADSLLHPTLKSVTSSIIATSDDAR